MTDLEFVRRMGPDPHSNSEELTPALQGCPDIWELSSGDFAVIGIRQTAQLSRVLPKSASCGPDEEIVIVPRSTFVRAKSDLPSE